MTARIAKVSTRSSFLVFRDFLENREPFNTHGALSGRVGATGTGRLPEPLASEYRRQDREGLIRYTVLSYATPIAWLSAVDGWTVPDVSYSPTTSAHQSKIRAAIPAFDPFDN